MGEWVSEQVLAGGWRWVGFQLIGNRSDKRDRNRSPVALLAEEPPARSSSIR